MRHKGKALKGPKRETLVIAREATYESVAGEENPVKVENDIVFIAEAVMSFDEFEIICPPPTPPKVLRPGNPPQETPNPDDPKYVEAIKEWARRKSAWMILKSLSPSPDLEWETVDLTKPETYLGYREELQDAGFNINELQLIVNLALKVNSVDEDKMEEARQRFLLRQAATPQD